MPRTPSGQPTQTLSAESLAMLALLNGHDSHSQEQEDALQQDFQQYLRDWDESEDKSQSVIKKDLDDIIAFVQVAVPMLAETVSDALKMRESIVTPMRGECE